MTPPLPNMERNRRFKVSVTVLTLFFLLVEGRFFYLQIVRGEDYRKQARISSVERERIPARRGLIEDREGRALAQNRAIFRVTVTPHYLRHADRDAVLDRLARILQWSREERQSVEASIARSLEEGEAWDPIRIPGRPVASRCPRDDHVLEPLQRARIRYRCPVDARRYDVLDADARTCPHDDARLEWKGEGGEHGLCPKCGRHYASEAACPEHDAELRRIEHNLRCPHCGRTWANQVARLRAMKHELPGVELETELRRRYPEGRHASHVVGYMNSVTAEDRREHPGVYTLHDRIGRAGIEKLFESELRGEAGRKTSVRGSSGHRRNPEELDAESERGGFEPPTPGHDVVLSLDLPLQKAVQKAFRYYRSGAAVVADPRTGAIRAMYSKPGYDPNQWAGGLSAKAWERIRSNPYSPLVNKALSGYAPGSVYKIVTATGVLRDGVFDPRDTVDCPGYYEYGGRRFRCWKRSGHGEMNLVAAIANSCDVYFYQAGERLGMDTLAHYGRLYGFGQETGIVLPERDGRVPTRGWHEEHTSLGWQPGLALSTAIGQGSVMSTPLQVARAFAALANGGHLLRMRIVDRIVDHDGEVVTNFQPEVMRTIDVPSRMLSKVRRGLVRVVNQPGGTAHGVAMDRMVVAGKTGTAEAEQVRAGASEDLAEWLKEDHSWFTAYAPAGDPQVVVTVFVEHGGSGSKHAAPVARRILRSWIRLGLYEPPDATARSGVEREGPASDGEAERP